NRVLRVSPETGAISIVTAWDDDLTTVGATVGPDGNLYVCQFGAAPYDPGSGRVDRVTPDGQVTNGVVPHLTTPIDVAFAPDGTRYVLEYAALPDGAVNKGYNPDQKRYVPFTGEVVRVNPDGSLTTLVTNLVFPT